MNYEEYFVRETWGLLSSFTLIAHGQVGHRHTPCLF